MARHARPLGAAGDDDATRSPRPLGLVSVVSAVAGLIWLATAFDGVDLRYVPYNSCRVLSPATVDALWRAQAGPLLLIVLAVLGTAVSAASAHHRQTGAPRSVGVSIGLFAAAAVGAGVSIEFSPARRDDSGIALFWIFLGLLLTTVGALVILSVRFSTGPRPTTRWAISTLALVTIYFLVLPGAISALTPTNADSLCLG